MTPKKKFSDVLLGSFIILGLALLVIFVFLIGKERKLFDTSTEVNAHFPNVGGLAIGADVMLAGVVVGHVDAIKFPIMRSDMPKLSKDVTIVMKISHKYMDWLREDSIARIDSKGLLGDKLINISIGSSDLPQIQRGGMLTSTPPIDFNKSLQQAQEILENVTETVAEAKEIFKGFVSEGGDVALANVAKSVTRILHEVETGKGILHQVIFDERAGKDTKDLIAYTKNIAKNIDATSKQIEDMLAKMRESDSTINALLLGDGGKKLLSSLSGSLTSLNDLLLEVKHGSGLAHELFYSSSGNEMLSSLNNAAQKLEKMVSNIGSGQGSLGLLIQDEGMYHQLYGIIGDLRRNRLLKAMIRFGMPKDNI